MNKASREYHRKHTTNSYNQDFIFYKPSQQLQKSPKLKVTHLNCQNDHIKILSLKNTLQTLFVQPHQKPYTKSVIQYPTYQIKPAHQNASRNSYKNQQVDKNLNNKLQQLTQRLKEIAQRPYFNQKLINQNLIPSKKSLSFVNQNKKSHEYKQKYKQHQQSSYSYALSQQLSRPKKTQSQYLKNNDHFNHNFMQFNKSKDHLNHKNIQINNKSNSLKRQKTLKNDKSVTAFEYQRSVNGDKFDNNIDKQSIKRPRGKTMINIINQIQIQQAQKQKIPKASPLQKNNPIHAQTQISTPSLNPKVSLEPICMLAHSYVCTLNVHNGPITSIIINTDCRRLLTSSYDYYVKQSVVQGGHRIIRKHKGRVNVMRMIQDYLITGGIDCMMVIKDSHMVRFGSPLLNILSHQKQFVNVATSSTVELFNIQKSKTQSKIQVKTKFYELSQKIHRDIYFSDNHKLSIVDWRVPSPLIKISQSQAFIDSWISDPYSRDFYQIQQQNLIHYSSKKIIHKFQGKVKDYSWKQDKVYFLMDNCQIPVFLTKNQQISPFGNILLHNSQTIIQPCKLQIKNNFFVVGTLDGTAIVNSFK